MKLKIENNFTACAILGSLLLLIGITTAKSQQQEKIIAKIGVKEISVDEFLYRSELTARPQIVKEKSVSLNNLIAEKILAIEAAGDRALTHHPGLQGRIKGIKEQLMREGLFQSEAYNKVEPDSAELARAYRQSLREYEVEFYTIRGKETAEKIKTWLDSLPHLADEMFKGLEERVGKKPLHKIKFLDQEDEKITETLFAGLLDTAAVIGPVRMSNGGYIVMKVTNWSDEMLFGVDQHARWKKVGEKIHRSKASARWVAYANSVMQDKKILFNEETTKKISDIAFEYYEQNKKTDSINAQVSEIPVPAPKIDFNAVFFTTGNAKWTVADFKKELLSHPLVYRTGDLNKENFGEQFRLAVVDMMRDHFLTREAYEKSLDTLKSIRSKVEMWKDALLAAGKQIQVMNSAIEKGIVKEENNSERLNYWGAYLERLQKKYAKSTWVNKKELEKIKLTSIDFIAMRPGVPYPNAVPAFPLFTRSDNLDYAKKKKL